MVSKENNFLFFILIVIALEAIFFSFGSSKLDDIDKKKESEIAKVQAILGNISFQAQAISIYDEALNRKIYGKNDEVDMPIASLTKIMTVVASLNAHKMDDIVSVSANAIKQEGDYGLFVNEKFKIQDIAKFTLIGSANDGAHTLAQNDDHLIEKMNDKARKIGMEDTLFFNFTGLDIDEGFAGAYASAQDVNIMALYALKRYPEVFNASVMPEINIKSENGFDHNIKNTNKILSEIPNILLSKTGFTPLAGGNLTIIYKNKYESNIAITVLGSTEEGRFSDMKRIIDVLNNI